MYQKYSFFVLYYLLIFSITKITYFVCLQKNRLNLKWLQFLGYFFFLHIEKNHRWKMIEIGQSITIYVWSNTEWYFCWKEDGPYLKSYIYNVILLKQAWIMKKVVNISYLLAIVSYMTYISTSNILHAIIFTINIIYIIFFVFIFV